jgi:hypothetical protein
MANSGPGDTWLVAQPGWWGDLPVIGCQVWYSDGSCVRGWNGPREGVQAVVAHHPAGFRTFCVAKDEYTFPRRKTTKLGEEIESARWRDIYETALTDPWRAG